MTERPLIGVGDDPCSSKASPAFLTAFRDERTSVVPEAEGVLVDITGEQIRFTLDDGETLTFDAGELRAAVSEEAA